MTNLFDNLSKLQITRLFDLLGVHNYRYKKNQEIIPTIKAENIIGIIMSGNAQILNIEYNGNEIIKEELTEYDIFGTNISSTNDENFQIVAKEDTEVVIIDYDKLINPKNMNHVYFNIFFRNLFDIINNKYKKSNERIRVLEKKQIREKLLEYFEIEYKKSYQKNIYLPLTLKELADYISVNRSAMFRELKTLKEEKIIQVKGNKITLLYK